MPLVGAPGDLYTQLLASVLCKVFLQYSLLFVCIFVLWISHPSLPLEVGARLALVGKYSTELFSVTVPGGGRSQGCHGYLLLILEHCPAPQTL